MAGQGKTGRSDSARQLAESRTLSNDLAVQSHASRIRLTGLLVSFVVLAACSAVSIALLGGYVQPPALTGRDAQDLGMLGMLAFGAGAAFCFTWAIRLWLAVAQVDMARRMLDAAIAAEETATA